MTRKGHGMNVIDDEISNPKHWKQIKHYWCTFWDDSKTAIRTMQDESDGEQPHKDAVLLPATDERLKRLNANDIPQRPEEIYVQYLTLAREDDWLRLTNIFDSSNIKPLFRGQSNYAWNLMTPLDRDRPEFVVKKSGLEVHEYDVLCQAQRRFHEFLTQLPDEDDRLSWLALLRHRGVPTRLLDVTRSFFIACYFALRDAEPRNDAVVWIFSREAIEGSFWNWGRNADETWLRKSPLTNGQYGDPIYWPFPKTLQKQYIVPTLENLKQPDGLRDFNFALTLDAAMRGFVEKPGVALAEPFWLSRRMDFQQGAFLIPFNVRYDFESNLFSSLGMLEIETSERNLPTDHDELVELWGRFKVVKLRIPSELHGILKIKLETMNIRDLTLFPDIDGALSHLTALVPRK